MREALADPAAAAAIAESGAQRVRERLDVRVGAAARLDLMGFNPGRNPFLLRPAETPRDDVPIRDRLSAAERDMIQRTASDAMATEIRALRDSLKDIQAKQQRIGEEVRRMHRDLMAVGQLALDDESATWRALRAARSAPDYETPFTESNHLVTVCIPTYTNHVQLLERSIPSALAQDYTNIEVVVVGDGAPPRDRRGN